MRISDWSSDVCSSDLTVFENDGIRLWTDGDDIAVASFKTKMHTVSDQVLDGLQEAIAHAERDFAGMVIWQPKEPFSAGADMAGALGLLQAGQVDAFEAMGANFQATSQRNKTGKGGCRERGGQKGEI